MAYERYQVGYLDPTNPETLMLSVKAELDKIQAKLVEGIEYGSEFIYFKEPTNPKPLQVAFADGTKWNPGDGIGWYMYTPELNDAGKVIKLNWEPIGSGASGDVTDVDTPGKYVREQGKWLPLPVDDVTDARMYARTKGGWISFNPANTTSVEYRYLAGTEDSVPVIDNPNIRIPKTNSQAWGTGFPSVDTSTKRTSIYVTTARINQDDDLVGSWSTPVLYSSPEGVLSKIAYAIGDENQYPSFNPQATGLPGSNWFYTMPNRPDGKYLWTTNRLVYTDGNPYLDWAQPARITGDSGDPGINGINGDVVETWFKESYTQPAAPSSYPPAGWSQTTPSNPAKPLWSTWVRVHADGTYEAFSFPIRVSGEKGKDGRQGPQGNHFETWYLKVPIKTQVSTPEGYPPVSTESSGVTYNWERHPISLPYTDQDNKIIKTQAYILYNGSGLAPDSVWTFPVIDNINGRNGTDGQQGLKGDPGISLYTWVKYADDIHGSNMSDSPTGKNFIGQAYNKATHVESNNPDDYTWTRMGVPGTNGQRGNLDIQVIGNSWDPGVAWDAILREARGQNPSKPITWDKVTIHNTSGTFANTYRFVSGTTRPGVWEKIAKVIDGALIVKGSITGQELSAHTITGDKVAANTITGNSILSNTITGTKIASKTISAANIAANTITSGQIAAGTITGDKIAAGTISGNNISGNSITGNKINASTRIVIGGSSSRPNEVVVLDASDPVNRIWVGNTTSSHANMRVTKEGLLYATGAHISGVITATSGTFTGNVTGSHIRGGDINIGNGKFFVDNAGNLTATSAKITGEVNANSGRIGNVKITSSWLEVNEGDNFSGGLLFRYANGKTSGFGHSTTPGAAALWIYGSSTDAPFMVAANGSMTATNADVTGRIVAQSGKIASATIAGTWLNIKSDISSGGLRVLKSDGSSQAGIGRTTSAMPNNLSGKVAVWAGGGAGSSPFRVSDTGSLYAQNADITGKIHATSGSFTGTISGAHIRGGDINIGNGKFIVDSNGNVTAKSATIVGNVDAGSVKGVLGSTAASNVVAAGFNTTYNRSQSTTITTIRIRAQKYNRIMFVELHAGGAAIVSGSSGTGARIPASKLTKFCDDWCYPNNADKSLSRMSLKITGGTGTSSSSYSYAKLGGSIRIQKLWSTSHATYDALGSMHGTVYWAIKLPAHANDRDIISVPIKGVLTPPDGQWHSTDHKGQLNVIPKDSFITVSVDMDNEKDINM